MWYKYFCKNSKHYIIFIIFLLILKTLDFDKFEQIDEIKKKIINKANFRNIFFIKKKLEICLLIFSILIPISLHKELLSDVKSNKFDDEKKIIKWEKVNTEKQYEKEIIWEKIEKNKQSYKTIKEFLKDQDLLNKNTTDGISSFNRSIVFNDSIVGPDVSWFVPSGFKWNNKYKFDSSVIGHSGRFEKGRNGNFWGWNKGDAVGIFYYQFLNKEKSSLQLEKANLLDLE